MSEEGLTLPSRMLEVRWEYRGKYIVIGRSGTDQVEFAMTPTVARQLAALLIESADAMEAEAALPEPEHLTFARREDVRGPVSGEFDRSEATRDTESESWVKQVGSEWSVKATPPRKEE